jgi:hypothetical protein
MTFIEVYVGPIWRSDKGFVERSAVDTITGIYITFERDGKALSMSDKGPRSDYVFEVQDEYAADFLRRMNEEKGISAKAVEKTAENGA